MWWYQRLSYVVNMLGRVGCSRDLSGLYQSLVIPAFTCGGVGDFRLLGIYLRQGDALEARSVVASTVHVFHVDLLRLAETRGNCRASSTLFLVCRLWFCSHVEHVQVYLYASSGNRVWRVSGLVRD